MTRLRTLGVIGGMTLLLAMSGCSVSVTDGGTDSASVGSASGRNTRSSTAATSDTANPEAAPTSAADPSDSSSGIPTAAVLRARFADDVVKQLDCSGGSITVSGAGTVAELTQPCDRVTVDGAGIVLLAQRIGSLDVQGASSMILATNIGAVKTDGAGVEVYWTSGQPTVSDTGAGTVARRIEEK